MSELVVRGTDQLLQAFQPVPAGEELGPIAEVLAQRLLGEPEVGEQHRRPVGAEARAVEAHVEQPVLIRCRRIERGVEQVAARSGPPAPGGP